LNRIEKENNKEDKPRARKLATCAETDTYAADTFADIVRTHVALYPQEVQTLSARMRSVKIQLTRSDTKNLLP
jgi:hypothetical protein